MRVIRMNMNLFYAFVIMSFLNRCLNPFIYASQYEEVHVHLLIYASQYEEVQVIYSSTPPSMKRFIYASQFEEVQVHLLIYASQYEEVHLRFPV